MIVSLNDVMWMPEFSPMPEAVVKRKLESIEDMIRAYTNNNFQCRSKRFSAKALGNDLMGSDTRFSVGDTIQITDSVNNGLYVIVDMENDRTVLNKDLIDCDYNLVTKVQYPSAVKEGTINLLLWEVRNRDKVGIQSETISRHSVTYFSQDSSNLVMGYPISLLGFLKPYMKARF